MSAVSKELLETIQELQNLPSLSNFALAGGTNLAIRYNHRKSIDIDLFCTDIIGIDGFKIVENGIKSHYGKAISGFVYPCKIDKQFIFLRFFISKPNGITIKVELLQNMKSMFAIEILNEVRLVSIKDIGLFKLDSASSRAGKKDIYDLDFITDDIPLTELYQLLKEKKEKFNKKEHKTIFDLDGEENSIDNPKLLLKFDNTIKSNKSKPFHLDDTIDIIAGSKNWIQARIEWKSKVRKLFRDLDFDYPTVQGIDV